MRILLPLTLRRRLLVGTLLCLGLAWEAQADEAVLPNGRRGRGDAAGRPSYAPLRRFRVGLEILEAQGDAGSERPAAHLGATEPFAERAWSRSGVRPTVAAAAGPGWDQLLRSGWPDWGA